MTQLARHKSFGSYKPNEEALKTPPTFDLNGQNFTAVPEVQGALLLDFVSKAQDTTGTAAATAILEFFEHVLEDESWERFDKLIKSKRPEDIVRVETLAEITSWLMEEYAERPEGQPGRS